MLESRFPASFIDLQTSDHHKSKKKSRKILQQNNKGDKSAQKKYEVSQEFTDLGFPSKFISNRTTATQNNFLKTMATGFIFTT